MADLQVRSLTKKSLNLGGIPAALRPWSGFPPGLLDSFYTHLQRASRADRKLAAGVSHE